MEMIKYGTFCAAVTALATACGGGVSHDAAPPGQPVAPVAPSESASRCSSATADVLKSAAQRDDWDVYKVLCSGDWAKVLIHTRATNANPPSIALFHYDEGGWRVVQYGSGFDCTNEGVPPSIAAELEC
ncbi:hypothetical protein ACXPWS_15260 [Mycobacterium sp. BMJ-28]